MRLPDKDLKQLKEFFQTQSGLEAVYLYGSYAQGKAKKDSDIDLALLFSQKSKQEQSIYSTISLSQKLSQLLKKKVEAQNINNKDLPFIFRVISTGKLIFGKDSNQRVNFEVKILRNYFDLQDFYQEYNNQIANLAKKGAIDAVRPFAY